MLERDLLKSPVLEESNKPTFFAVPSPETINFLNDAYYSGANLAVDEKSRAILKDYFESNKRLRDFTADCNVEKPIEVARFLLNSMRLIWEALPKQLQDRNPPQQALRLKRVSFSKDYQEMMSKRFKGKPRPPEFVAGMPERTKLLWQRPDYREHFKHKSPEVKDKISRGVTRAHIRRGTARQEKIHIRPLWIFAKEHDLLPRAVESGLITQDEIKMLRRYIALGKQKSGISEELFDRFSIAVARLA